MEWKKFTIKTTSQAEDIITGMLAEREIYSVEIEDSVPLTDLEKSQMFVDIAPTREDDGTAYVSFYIEEDEDWKSLLTAVASDLESMKAREKELGVELGDCTISTSNTEDVDWINNWKKYFNSFYIDDILFTPSWELAGEIGGDAKEPAMVINIDPGTAFGTGKHETTQLCIKKLREVVKPGMQVLDVGTGSGILAMMALKFGADSVYATDLDPCSVDACEDNFKKNDLENADFKLCIGNIIDDKAVQDEAGYDKYDVVLANILADVLIPLTPVVVKTMKPGGIFITSGIIEGREKDVAKAMEDAGLTVEEIGEMGEWRRVTGRKLDV